jgi:hypothetical protein
VNYPLAVTQRINARSLLFVLTELMYVGGGLAVFIIVETFRALLNEGRFPSSRDCDYTRKIGSIG